MLAAAAFASVAFAAEETVVVPAAVPAVADTDVSTAVFATLLVVLAVATEPAPASLVAVAILAVDEGIRLASPLAGLVADMD